MKAGHGGQLYGTIAKSSAPFRSPFVEQAPSSVINSIHGVNFRLHTCIERGRFS